MAGLERTDTYGRYIRNYWLPVIGAGLAREYAAPLGVAGLYGAQRLGKRLYGASEPIGRCYFLHK